MKKEGHKNEYLNTCYLIKQVTCRQSIVYWTWPNITRTVFFFWNTITWMSWNFNKCIALCIITSTCPILFCWIGLIYNLSFLTACWFEIDTVTHASVGLKIKWLVTYLWTVSSRKWSGKYSLASCNITKEQNNKVAHTQCICYYHSNVHRLSLWMEKRLKQVSTKLLISWGTVRKVV